jgi:COMPASS component BRE2
VDPSHLKREKIAIEFKSQEYFKSLEYGQEKEMMELMEPKKKIKLGDGDHGPGTATSSQAKKSVTVKNMPNRRKTGSRRGTSSVNNTKTVPARPLPTLENSHIAFFINGECQGVVFQDLYSYLPLRRLSTEVVKRSHHYQNEEAIREHKPNPFDDGTFGYYPFISLFNEAKVKVNIGLDFEFWPGDDIESLPGFNQRAEIKAEEGRDSSTPQRTWRPLCERYPEFMAKQWTLDEKEEAEAALAVSNGFVPSDAPKKPKETGSTRGHVTGGPTC